MRIAKASLLTNFFNETLDFYQTKLGFTIKNQTATTFEVKIGKDLIEFTESHLEEAPFYHFAFDIPAGSFEEAKQWLQRKVDLSTEGGNDQITFDILDSSSVYFEDPSGNIVEFIERRKTNPKSDVEFSAKSIQGISEMSFIVDKKLEVANELLNYDIKGMFNSEVKADGLSFMTDQENKVFILLVNPGRKWLFSEKKSKMFEQEIVLDSGLVLKIDRENNVSFKEAVQ
ncbi:VOC family protein [uncultured Vagococcus sp.]|uniref:VOC family protein n=1 Tax=uncultured Vagococcus sp. TaxID=189676 RepID=UPI00258384CD|nr:VOC family protein [uncultured Vagococcus sp.]